jgi:hypothetical protein
MAGPWNLAGERGAVLKKSVERTCGTSSKDGAHARSVVTLTIAGSTLRGDEVAMIDVHSRPEIAADRVGIGAIDRTARRAPSAEASRG